MNPFIKAITTIALMGLACSPPPVEAAAYLKLGDIQGESTDAAHQNWIDLNSFGHVIEQEQDAATGRATGRRQHKPFSISKPVDKASPLLLELLVRGETLPLVRLEFVTPTPRSKYYQITFQNVRLTSCHSFLTRNAAGDGFLDEVIKFDYEEIKWTYTEFDNEGAAARDHAYKWNLLHETGESDVLPPGSFRVSGGAGASGAADSFNLSWTGFEEFTYRVHASPDDAGPYEFVRDYQPAADGEQELSLPRAPTGMFYKIEKLPAP